MRVTDARFGSLIHKHLVKAQRRHEKDVEKIEKKMRTLRLFKRRRRA